MVIRIRPSRQELLLATLVLAISTASCFTFTSQPQLSFDFYAEITEIDDVFPQTTYPDNVREWLGEMSCGNTPCGFGSYQVKHEWTDNQGHSYVNPAQTPRYWWFMFVDGPCASDHYTEIFWVPYRGKVHMPCRIYTGAENSEWTVLGTGGYSTDYSDELVTAGYDMGTCCLYADQTMGIGNFITSPNGDYRLLFQADGNLVLYDVDGVMLWESGTSAMGGVSVKMVDDGMGH